ncbi:MAG: membrane protein insertase YidC [Bacteroidaceae bacterium]|nr:membrane protein insertase YidC [Bacteroidaceae bacterium]
MDKKSIIAYVLIGLVIIGFFKFNQKSPEQIERQKAYNERIELEKQQKQAAEEARAMALQAQIDILKNDTTSVLHNIYNGIEKPITLANNKVEFTLSTLGGHITAAKLKEYNDQQGNQLVLFDSKDKLNATAVNKEKPGFNKMNFALGNIPGAGNINTADCYFKEVYTGTDSVVLRLDFNNNRYIDFTYTLRPGNYIVDLYIKSHNMESLLGNESIDITWNQLLRQQEPGYEFEQRYTNVSYKLYDEDVESLKPNGDDKAKQSNNVSWIAYKNQFFSSILIAGDRFSNTSITSKSIEKGQNLLKACTTTATAPFDPSGNISTALQFYFGPNKYSTLKESSAEAINPGNDLDLQELIYFGWPIVRWINRYFVMYLFDLLSSTGLNMGIVLILLTIIVKICVYPFTKKSYISSAKMRALKPHIDAVNAKYPKQEDALKKQQETMAIYQKYGASPMGGCLPMLIQMPIFIALFNFVPNAIELRQESFLWAHDLSAFDSLISWNANIWPIGNHISIFCLLFSVTQIINTYYTSKMQPSVGGPEMEQQQKMMRWMMYIMPVVFFFVFNEYSSGLNLYYFLSTLSSILIMIYLRKSVKEDELLKKMEAYAEKNKDSVAKHTNMMARLEALQEQQKKLIEERERIKNNRKN